MEWLGNFAGNNGIPTLITAVIIMVLAIMLVRKGLVSFKGHGLQVGQDMETRTLIQSQFTYSRAKIDGLLLRFPAEFDIHHAKYVLGKVKEVVEDAIVFNNMTTDPAYVRSKQELVYWTVMKRVGDEHGVIDYFKGDEFKAICFDFTRELIQDLVDMKRRSI